MRKTLSVLTAFLLSLCIIIAPATSALAYDVTSAGQDDAASVENGSFSPEMQVDGSGSLGDLISQELDQEQIKQQESLGNYVYSVRVNGNTATVDFKTNKYCSIVVALFEENGNKMITSGCADVSPELSAVDISFEEGKVPQYFYIRAYMVEQDTLKPLGKVYESPNYTRSMVEFFDKTTDDFDEDQVLNLDDEKNNNFVVYNDDVKQIRQSNSVNRVKFIDEENDVYVFENINTDISSLQPGDVFVSHAANNDLLIVKVSEITVNGTTASVKGEDTSLEEVFKYVKIDTMSDLSDAVVDNSGLSDGVTQREDPKTTSSSAMAKTQVTTESESNKYLDIDFRHGKLEAGVSETKALSYDIDEEVSETAGEVTGHGNLSAKISVKGNVTLKMTLSIKVFLQHKGEKYVEFKADYYLSSDVHISAEVKYRVRIGRLQFMPIECINVVFEPYFEFEAQVKLDASFKLTGCVGFRGSESNGIENISTKPECEPSVHAEGRLYVGLDLQPSINIIDEKFVKAYLIGKVGVEARMSVDMFKQSEDVRHECISCAKGNLNFLYSLKIGVRLLNDNKYDWSKKLLDRSVPIGEFYYSDDFHELGWGKCPHQQFRCTITVKDENNNPVSGAMINNTYGTDPQGRVDIFFSPGKVQITAVKDNLSSTDTYDISEPKAIVIKLTDKTQSGGSSGYDPWSGEDPFADYFSNLEVSVKDVQIKGNTTAVITSNNTLYMYGNNESGQVGCGSKTSIVKSPCKVLENVKMVDIDGYGYSIALTNNGDLYTWGNNDYGQLGDGTSINSRVPIKVMSNVISASAGGYTSYAVTKDGNLYAWGNNEKGQLGNGIENSGYSEPQKIMRNILSVCSNGGAAAAVTNDGCLYVFGDGYSSIPKKVFENVSEVLRGDKFFIITESRDLYSSTNLKRNTPILSEVIKVDSGSGHYAALTKQGDLYLWGNNHHGQVGTKHSGVNDGSQYEYYSKPTKILSGVVSFALGYEHSAAVDSNGKLYTWGDHYYGQLGNNQTTHYGLSFSYFGSGSYSCTDPFPREVMDNCAKVFAGQYDTFVATFDNGVMDSYIYAFGRNDAYQLCDGTTTDKNKPTRITLTGGKSTSSSAGTGGTETMTKTYEGLEPNGIYNFYVMKSRSDPEPLSSGNLYYISQETADENGMLAITYIPAEAYETADRFVVAMDKTSLSGADAEISDLIYNGDVQYVKPLIMLDDTELTEGEDYELSGDYAVTEAGEYTLVVNGIGKYSGTLNLSFSVVKEFLNLSDIDRDIILLGDEVNITAKGVGGTGDYTYTYYFRSLDDPYWSVLETDTNNTSMTFEPYKSGQMYIRVDVKDSSGTVRRKAMLLDVKSRDLKNTSEISASKLFTGGTLNVTAGAEGGTGSYKFAVYYKNTFDDKWKTGQNYSDNNRVSITFDSEGMYDVSVKVKDSAGHVVRKYFAVTVENETIQPLKSRTTVSQTTIKLGASVNIRAAASGGKGKYSFAVYYRATGETEWTTAQTFNENPDVTITPDRQTQYEICVRIRDESGKIVKKYFSVKVVSPVLANVSRLSTADLDLGKTVTLMGQGTGGDAPYTFAFLYKKEGAASWSLIGTKYASKSTETLTPKEEGVFDIRINVRDDGGNIATKEFKLTVTERLDPLVNTSQIGAESINLGETVKVTASAQGGKPSYAYAYYYRSVGSTSWLKSGTEFGTANTATIKPAKGLDYEVRVVVKDKKGNKAEKLFALKVIAPDPLTNTSALSSSTVVLGSSVTVNASATGGKPGYNYSVLYKPTSQTSWITGQSYGANSTITFTPKSAVTYTVRVKVKDSSGKEAAKDFELSVTKPSKPENKSTLSSTSVTLGDTITITGSATGGTSPYQYSVLYQPSGQTSWTTLQSYTSTSTIKYTPKSATKYTVRVKVKDSNGSVADKDFTVTVTKPLANNSKLSAASVTLGDTITITGSATGGTSPYQYSVLYQPSGQTSWTTLQSYTSTSTIKYTPKAATNYIVRVKVKDSAGKEAVKEFDVTVSKALTNTSKISATSAKLGAPLKITASATGGKSGYQYAVLYKPSARSSWITAQSYGANSAINISPKAVGSYTVRVKVKDSAGKEAVKEFSVTITK